MRDIVKNGYNTGNYQEKFRKYEKLNDRESRFFKKMCDLIPLGSKILDLGSGTGIPYDLFLVNQGYDVIGVDFSKKHIEIAKQNVPSAKYILQDFTKLNFPPESFNAIISTYAIFHIPRNEHVNLLTKIYNYLISDGIFLVTMGMYDNLVSIEEFIGSKMAWSSFSAEKNLELLKNAGFKILHTEKQLDNDEHHLWVLGRK